MWVTLKSQNYLTVEFGVQNTIFFSFLGGGFPDSGPPQAPVNREVVDSNSG